MQTQRPYANIAVCHQPGCWNRFTLVCVNGFDEKADIVCQECHKPGCTISAPGDFDGDELRDRCQKYDKLKEEIKEADASDEEKS